VSLHLKIVISFTVLLTILSISDCLGQENSKKNLRLTADGWILVVKQVGDERDSFGYQLKEKQGGLVFSITGYPGSPRIVKWTKDVEEVNMNDYPYIIMKYQAGWLNSPEDEIVSLSIIDNKGTTKDTTLLRMSDLIVDNRPHTLIIKNSKSSWGKKITVSLNTRSSKAYLFIKSIDFVKSEKEFTDCIGYEIPVSKENTFMQSLDITNRYNTNYTDLQKGLLNTNPIINDGGKYFSGSKVEIEGVPFQVRPEGLNLLSFPAESKVNDEMIVHFGQKVRRGSVAPISRDDKIEVNVQSPASEVYFLLAAEHPRTSPRDPRNRAFMIEDVETFAVELVYEDGTIDFAFPYSIKDENHIIQGTFGAYVVPASGKPLNKVVFHNRIIGKNFYLGAVTINKDQNRLYSQLVMEPGPKIMQTAKVQDPVTKSPYLNYQNGILKAGNTYVDMTIDAGSVFSITQFDNKWLGEKAITLSPSAGFEVTLGDKKVEAKDIRLLNVSDVTGTTGKEITLTYGLKDVAGPLELRILVSVTDEPEVGMQMTVVNKSDKDLNAKVVFPVMRGIQMGKYEDVWYYYPAYRNAFSNQSGSFDHIYSYSFPLQFYDIYNPVLGGGFYLATRETDVNEMRRYGLRKNESGITCYLEYPKLHTLLKPNMPNTFCKTVLGVHTGDWHAALNIYKKWLQTWYKPLNSQNKQWYRECFWLLCDYVDNLPSDVGSMDRNFTWYDTITKHYRMRDILEEHKRTVGRYPDILHFWSWQYNMPRGYSRWGAYGTNGEYEKMGGVQNFNRAINDIQKNMHIPVSLYLDASLCNRNLPIAKQILGSIMKTAGGSPLIAYSSFRMCPGSKPWRDYIQSAYRRVNKDLGVNILYVDEYAAPFYFGHTLNAEFMCFSNEHEHGVPANMNLEVGKYMQELRTAVPKEAVLYYEFPDVDVNSRFYDCYISYYLSSAGDLKDGNFNIAYDLPLNETGGLSDPYLSLYKFVFPGLVQLVLPTDISIFSWNRLKFTFLNGDAIYDSFWLRDESKAEAFMVKSHDIKKKYADCFASNEIEPLVPTEQTGILVNKFTGKGRTLWTIYNQRFTTVRGEILKIRHVQGATYYDVWNDKPIQARLSGDYAYIPLELYPQAVGCILQEVPQ